MEEIKIRFREYFKQSKGSKIFIALLCAAAAILFAVWIVLRLDLFHNEALPFDPISSDQEGKYVSLEVVGVDNWSAVRDGEYYYVVEGSDELLYLVRMTPDDFDSMQDQYAYWLAASAGAAAADETAADPPVPVPVEIAGYSTAFPDQLLETVADTYGFGVEDMSNYLGRYYLDADAKLRAREFAFLPLFAAVCAFIALFLLFNEMHKRKNTEKALAALEHNGQLLDAWNEFNMSRDNDPGDGVLLTDHYIFTRSSSDIIPYRDIVWAYKFVVRRRFTEINSYVQCCMRDGTKRQVSPVRNRNEAIDRILAAVADKNHDALIGFTKENKQRYKELISQTTSGVA